MTLNSTLRVVPLALLVPALAIGCGGPESGGPANGIPGGQHASDTEPPPPPGDVHPTEGPHHGQLIELGGEEYHAELLDDEDQGTVTIYILDGSAKEQVPIDAQQITINVSHEGQPEQFHLVAAPDEGDPEGTSSRFVIEDAALLEHLHDENSGARLMLKINGKSYNAPLAHRHDHDHDHDHKR